MRVLDLFSGIGGFSLGLERAGFKTVAFCEIEPYPRAVLAKHWPRVPIYDDVRTLTAERLAADGISVDVICGGFPCQDISNAGKRAGIEGERSGLWSEFARLIGELRPRYVIVENVAALLGRGIGRVLGDLAEIGYDAEWQIISAADVGAQHLRERVWIVAYSRRLSDEPERVGGVCFDETGESQKDRQERQRIRTDIGDRSEDVAYSSLCGGRDVSGVNRTGSEQHEPCERGSEVADSAGIGQQGQRQPIQRRGETQDGKRKANILESIRLERELATEPNVGRVANGVPARVDRLKGLGNAVVPQIPEIIGRAIMQAEGVTP